MFCKYEFSTTIKTIDATMKTRFSTMLQNDKCRVIQEISFVYIQILHTMCDNLQVSRENL